MVSGIDVGLSKKIESICPVENGIFRWNSPVQLIMEEHNCWSKKDSEGSSAVFVFYHFGKLSC
jgi:hypothetical protein